MFIDRYRLDGKTAFISGGGRGIGLASAHALAEAGARVVIADRDSTVLAGGFESLVAAKHEAESVLLDVTDSAEVARIAQDLNARYGAVDVVIANAGIAWPDTPGEDMTDEVWLNVVNVNLNGTFWTCRAFGKHMVQRGRGAIVTTGSMSGIISNRPQRQVHYNAAKAGVHHMTKSLAGEWGLKGVRVNAVAPTYVDTMMSGPNLRKPEMGKVWLDNTPTGRAVTAEEIASVILFLATEASSALTGSIVVADAGYTIW